MISKIDILNMLFGDIVKSFIIKYRIALPLIAYIIFYIIYIIIMIRKKTKKHYVISSLDKVKFICATIGLIGLIILQILIFINYGNFLDQ